MAGANDALFVTSLEKGMRILNAFGEVQTEMGLTGLSRSTGLGMSATQRYANTLLKLGYLHKDPRTKQYSLTLRVLDLAHSYLWSSTLAQLAMPKLIELSNTISASVNLALLDDTDIVYVIRIPSSRSRFAGAVIGRRLPALNTSSGRAMISTLPPSERNAAAETWPLSRVTEKTTLDRKILKETIEQAAYQGYCITSEELRIGERAAAAPILGHSGGAKAAVQFVTSTSFDLDGDDFQIKVKTLVETAISLETSHSSGQFL